MGCDIHAFIEWRHAGDDSDWLSFGGECNPRRHYPFFDALAGARGELSAAIVPPRGIPDDLGRRAWNEYWHLIAYEGTSGDGAVTPEEAARFVSLGSVYRGTVPLYRQEERGLDGTVVVTTTAEHVGKPYCVSDPDYHSPSWLTPDEWEQALASIQASDPPDPEYYAMLAAMRAPAESARAAPLRPWPATGKTRRSGHPCAAVLRGGRTRRWRRSRPPECGRRA